MKSTAKPNQIYLTRQAFVSSFAEALNEANGCPLDICRVIATRHFDKLASGLKRVA